ncbi:hypothetical protein PRZ61_12390 [Halomonas pacifica]|uniref:hypothetical protein n=1 Tax=Bisbaumannia pacifica TaxID=77098 RepID=UPI002359D1DE|nr:hypothetical protein [Halomonas pacifica]MDC8804240.1 hypothetical protein [Halomonas pacifica]
MSEHTLVVRFPEGESPVYSAGTKFQGGSVVAVCFDGNQLEVADEMEEALEGLLSIVDGVGPEEEQLVANARNVLRRRAFGI